MYYVSKASTVRSATLWCSGSDHLGGSRMISSPAIIHPFLYTAALPFPFTTILRPAVASRRSRVAVAVLSSG